MWKNMEEGGRPQMTIWHMRTACWTPVSTDTHSEYVILTDFPLQQWLHERASLSRCTYAALLLLIYFYVSVNVVSKIGFLVTVWLSLICSFVCSGFVWRIFQNLSLTSSCNGIWDSLVINIFSVNSLINYVVDATSIHKAMTRLQTTWLHSP